MSATARHIVRRTCPPVVTPCVWPLVSGRPHSAHELWLFPLISDRPQPLCSAHVGPAVAYYAERLASDPDTAATRLDLPARRVEVPEPAGAAS